MVGNLLTGDYLVWQSSREDCLWVRIMKKVAILTDSTCCLPKELVEKYDICVVPLEIIYEDKSYRDGIDMTPGEVYKIMRKKENLPTTSTASAGDFLNAYRHLTQKAESVLCITVTSLQSKTFEAASAAKELAKEEISDTTIEVFDSRSVAGALGFIVLEAARAVSQGAELAQAAETVRNMMGRVNFLAMLDTLYYLARTGRTARAAAWAGSLLSMKPIVEHSPAIGETYVQSTRSSPPVKMSGSYTRLLSATEEASPSPSSKLMRAQPRLIVMMSSPFVVTPTAFPSSIYLAIFCATKRASAVKRTWEPPARTSRLA